MLIVKQQRVSDMFRILQQSLTNHDASVTDTVPAVVTAVERQQHKSFSLFHEFKKKKKKADTKSRQYFQRLQTGHNFSRAHFAPLTSC